MGKSKGVHRVEIVKRGWERRRGDAKGPVGRENRHRDMASPLKSSSSSVGPIRNLVPEERVVGGSNGLSLLGGKFRQKVFQLLRKQPGWGRPLRPLPLLQMRQNPADHMRLLDHRDHAQRAAATTAQGIDVIDLAELEDLNMLALGRNMED